MPADPNTTEDLYSDTPANPEAAAAEEAPQPEPEAEAQPEAEGGKTAVLPTEFFGGGVKPGDTCTVRVVRVHDNQVEVEYETESSGGEMEEAPMPKGDMASMME